MKAVSLATRTGSTPFLWTVRLAALGALLTAVSVATIASAEDGKVALEIELPEPSFEGTPLDYFSPNLEKRSFEPRPAPLVPEGTKLVSKGKPVTASGKPAYGKVEFVTDGDKNYKVRSIVELPTGVEWVQIDLEEQYKIFAIVIWHYHRSERVYFDVVAQVSDDAKFGEATTVFNNDHDNSSGLGEGTDKEYIETNEGKLIEVDGVTGRYVRLYSNGNTTDDTNHYIEVEVYGRPVK